MRIEAEDSPRMDSTGFAGGEGYPIMRTERRRMGACKAPIPDPGSSIRPVIPARSSEGRLLKGIPRNGFRPDRLEL
jgi:hypothetical protein